jgi:protein-tyrosine-phosphatase
MMPKDHPVILYVCVHNAGRSQMAAAFTRQLGAGRIAVRSAGSAPAQEIHPTVVQVMAEVGVDLSPEYPKPIADELVREADVVITMGCGDACPVYPGTKYEDWELDDPAGQPIEKVRELRDEIRAGPTARGGAARSGVGQRARYVTSNAPDGHHHRILGHGWPSNPRRI